MYDCLQESYCSVSSGEITFYYKKDRYSTDLVQILSLTLFYVC